MNLLKVNWRKVFKFAIDNVSALDELMELIETSKDAVADGKITNDERSQLMSKYWNLIRALKENQNQQK
tara:strand:- start:1028 stop:1234 length:207 start_codon:yes stop_codon:yes gene_type:complete